MNKELISVVVPIYNSEVTVERCIRSLICQSHRNLEIILVDDGSTDSSTHICESFVRADGRVRLIRTENRGASVARNIGILAANGRYIAFCDSDDYTDEQWLSELSELAQRSGADIVVCGYELLGQKKKAYPFSQNIAGCVAGETAMLAVLTHRGCGGYLWNKLFRRDLLRNNLLDESLHFCEDMYAVISCLNDGASMFFINKPLYHYCFRSGSLSNDFSEKSLSILAAYEKAASLNVTERIRQLLYARRTEAAANLSVNALRCGFRNIAAELKVAAFAGKKYLLRNRDITFFEKIRFVIKLYAPLLGIVLSQNNKGNQK